MSKIGNTRTGITQSFPSKQNITGNGGTSYTLNHTVTQPEELEVFVNNVRQNPGDAYTVNHNTITFAGAIASTDSCYAVFQNNVNKNPAQFDVSRTVTTLNATNADVSRKIAAGILEGEGGITYDPPGSSGSDTSTNVGLALHSGKRIVLGHQGYIRTIIDATASQPLKIGQSGTGYIATTQIYGGGSNGVHLFYDANRKLETTSIGVDITGSLNISDQPAVAFQGTSNGNTTVNNGEKFGSTDQGNPAFTTSNGLRAHISSSGITYNSATGVFTVSTAGKYLLYFQAYNNGAVVTSTRVAIYHNNTQMMLAHSPDLNYGTIHVNHLANAAANDYFDFRHESGANRDFFMGSQHLGGYIVKVA